jgi:hypothetical protein
MSSMRKLMTRQEAQELLGPYQAVLSEVIRAALVDWEKLLSEVPHLTGGLRGRTRSSYVHERIVHRLQAVVPQHHGLRLGRARGGLAILIVRDQLILKLKKLDDQLRSSNIMTGQTALFNAQGVLEGMDAVATNATAGYTLDAIGALPLRIVVVCWQDEQQLWAIDLEERAAAVGGTVLTIPAEPSGGAPRAPRVRAKRITEKASSDEA